MAGKNVKAKGTVKRESKKDSTHIGEDEYTTVMLRNIPNKYTREMLVKELRVQGFTGKYDFLYIPTDFANDANPGYAFVNFRTNESRISFEKKFDGRSVQEVLPAFKSTKICDVKRAKHQGLQENVDRLRTSDELMGRLAVRPDCTPLMFDDDGNLLHFETPPPPVDDNGNVTVLESKKKKKEKKKQQLKEQQEMNVQRRNFDSRATEGSYGGHMNQQQNSFSKQSQKGGSKGGKNMRNQHSHNFRNGSGYYNDRTSYNNSSYYQQGGKNQGGKNSNRNTNEGFGKGGKIQQRHSRQTFESDPPSRNNSYNERNNNSSRGQDHSLLASTRESYGNAFGEMDYFNGSESFFPFPHRGQDTIWTLGSRLSGMGGFDYMMGGANVPHALNLNAMRPTPLGIPFSPAGGNQPSLSSLLEQNQANNSNNWVDQQNNNGGINLQQNTPQNGAPKDLNEAYMNAYRDWLNTNLASFMMNQNIATAPAPMPASPNSGNAVPNGVQQPWTPNQANWTPPTWVRDNQ